jgi:predicted phage terminase large subunit-like protein
MNKEDLLLEMQQDMLLFGRMVMPNMFSSESPPFHYDLTDQLLDTESKQINIIAPRGHAKSSVAAGIFPLFHLMFTEGVKVIVLVSRTQSHATKLLGTIKDVLDYSQEFRYFFGYWGMQSAKKWTNTEVELKDGSLIICKGTGQQIRGIKHGNQRPTLLILDDPEDENNTKTAEAMEYNLRWLLQSGVPSLDPLSGRICVIGTPQHERCMVETLKEMKGWNTLEFRPDLEKGVALWDEVWPIDKLKQKKAELESINRLSVFYREYLCQIVGDEDALFRQEYIQNYDGYIEKNEQGLSTLILTNLNGEEVEERRPVNIFTGVDPASSTKKTADYSVIFNIAVDEEGNRFCLPYYRKRATPLDLADAIINNFKTYKSTKTRIESVGYQEMLRQYIKEKAEEMGMFIPGLEIKENPRTSKSYRLESLQPLFASNKVYIQPTMQNFIDELLLYPRGKHDDLLDGFFYANKNCYKPLHESSFTAKKDKLFGLLTRKSWKTL